MQQYYAHSEYLSRGQTKNVNTLTINSLQMIVMSNDSSIEIYEYAPQGLALTKSLRLHCTIKHLLVIPDKHHHTDYLFILDTQGRYAFWKADGEFQMVQNQLHKQSINLELYKQSAHITRQSQFCSQMHHFEVLDTRGAIFFNVGQEITLLDYSVKGVGLKVEKPKRIKLQVIKYRYAGWIQNAKHEKWLGLIEQVQERTVLRVYNLDKSLRVSQQAEILSYEKINLLEFCCPANGKLLVLTHNEVTLLELPSLRVVCAYGVRERFGKLLSISHELYGYVGEELSLFSGTNMKSFGSLTFNDQNILANKGIAEVRFLRDLADKGKLISIVTLSNQIFLIILYDNIWKLCHKIQCLTSIYSMHQMQNKELAVVMTKGFDRYQVAVVEREIVLPLAKQQKYDSRIEKIVAIDQGNGLFVSSDSGILLLKYNKESILFNATKLNIPKQQLLTANDYFCVSTQMIYTLNPAEEEFEPLYQDQIVAAMLEDTRLVYINSAFNFVSLSYQSRQVTHLREAVVTEYAWHLVQEIMLAFQSDDLSHFYAYRASELVQKVELSHHAIVSSVIHLTNKQSSQVLVIGFVDGCISVFGLPGFEAIACFQNYGNEPVSLQSGQHSVIVFSKTKQFLLKLTPNPTLQQIHLFSDDSSFQSLTYLQSQKQLLIVQKLDQQSTSLIKTVSLAHLLQNSLSSQKAFSFKKEHISSYSNQPPIVYTQGNFIYIAIAKQIQIYNTITRHFDAVINNFYVDVIGFQRIEFGIMVYGIDQLSRNILTLLQPNTHQVLNSITLILKDNRYIKAIKSLGQTSNRFVCRTEKFTNVYELTEIYELTELTEITTDFQGYFLDIEPTNELFAITDSYRFAAFYNYADRIVPVSRFVAKVEINELALMDRSVVVADRGGKLTILEYNFENQSAPLRMLMTEVASIDVGSEVITLTKLSNKEVLYATAGGKIGMLKIIGQQVFLGLSQVESSWPRGQKRCEFSYQEWRGRQPKQDKLVDCDLVAQYLQQSRTSAIQSESQRQRSVEELYKLIVG